MLSAFFFSEWLACHQKIKQLCHHCPKFERGIIISSLSLCKLLRVSELILETFCSLTFFCMVSHISDYFRRLVSDVSYVLSNTILKYFTEFISTTNSFTWFAGTFKKKKKKTHSDFLVHNILPMFLDYMWSVWVSLDTLLWAFLV